MSTSNRFKIKNVYWSVQADSASIGWGGVPVEGSTRHFLDAPMQTTADDQITLKVAAESYAAYQDRIIPEIEHVGVETKTCVEGTPMVYPGNGAKTNPVAPMEATFTLQPGENVFEMTYIGSDNVTEVTKQHYVYKKTSLSTVNVATKVDLIQEIAKALTSSNGAGHDIINVTAPMEFEWNEFNELHSDGGTTPKIPTAPIRDYPPVIQGNDQLIFKMNFLKQLKDNGRSWAEARGAFVNFPVEQIIASHVHFKQTQFGVQGTTEPLTSQLDYSTTATAGGFTPCLTLTDCTVYGGIERAADAAVGYTSPAILDNVRNRYPDTPSNYFPEHGWWAGITTSYAETRSLVNGKFDATVSASANNLYRASVGPALKSVEATSSTRLVLTFQYPEDVEIFRSVAKWTKVHDYGKPLFTVSVNGGAEMGYTAATQLINNDFEDEIVGGSASNEIYLEGTIAGPIAAAMHNVNAPCTVEMIGRSSQFPSQFATTTAIYPGGEGLVSRDVQTSYINTELVGCCFQGGLGNAERLVGVNFQQNRGDIGHNATCIFNMTLESGDLLLSSDFFDTTHADIVQLFRMYDRKGKIYQNIYKGSDGINTPDTTIAWILDRTEVTRQEGIVIDNIEEDPAVYTWDAGSSSVVGSQTIDATFSGKQRNVRMSNLQLYGSSCAFRWDFPPNSVPTNATLDTSTYSSTNFHNVHLFAYEYQPLNDGSGPDGKGNDGTKTEHSTVLIKHDALPAGVDPADVGSWLRDYENVGTPRSSIIWTGNNTVFIPPAP